MSVVVVVVVFIFGGSIVLYKQYHNTSVHACMMARDGGLFKE